MWRSVPLLTLHNVRAIEDHLPLLELMLVATRTLETDSITAHILTSVTHKLHSELSAHADDPHVGAFASALASSLEKRLSEQDRWETGSAFVAAALLSPSEDLSFLGGTALNDARALLVADSLQFDEPMPGFPVDLVKEGRARQLSDLAGYYKDDSVQAMWQGASSNVLSFWKAVSSKVVTKSDSQALKGLSGFFASFKVWAESAMFVSFACTRVVFNVSRIEYDQSLSRYACIECGL